MKTRSYKKWAAYYNQDFWKSVNAAIEGIVHTIQNERNMRIHFIAAGLVLIGAMYIRLTSLEMIALLFAISFVLVAEMFNTAIECAADILAKNEYHPVVKIIKDVSAGAVFVAAVNAAMTGYILFNNHVELKTASILTRVRYSPWHLTLIAIFLCVACVFTVKALRGDKNLLRGGMPSGHAAVAFAIWMIVSMATLNALTSILVFFLAFMVARSRVTRGIHSLVEVIMGSFVGALLTLLIFQVLL
jgi:diacylglycerol kinase (ATP)